MEILVVLFCCRDERFDDIMVQCPVSLSSDYSREQDC